MPKKTSRFVLFAGIPFCAVKDSFKMSEDLEKLVGHSGGSGAGFGFRDLDWSFKTKKARDEAKAKLVAYFKKKKLGLDDLDARPKETHGDYAYIRSAVEFGYSRGL